MELQTQTQRYVPSLRIFVYFLSYNAITSVKIFTVQTRFVRLSDLIHQDNSPYATPVTLVYIVYFRYKVEMDAININSHLQFNRFLKFVCRIESHLLKIIRNLSNRVGGMSVSSFEYSIHQSMFGETCILQIKNCSRIF